MYWGEIKKRRLYGSSYWQIYEFYSVHFLLFSAVKDIILCPTESVVQLASCDKPDAKTIFMVHPIEGNVSHLRQLASSIAMANIYGLQYTQNIEFASITELAAAYIKVREISSVVEGKYYRR